MAKKCQHARERKREKLVKSHAERRAALKAIIVNLDSSEEERRSAMFKLTSLPRDSSKVRLTSRCQVTGVSRAVYRKFRLNRIVFRSMAHEGMLPGVLQASW